MAIAMTLPAWAAEFSPEGRWEIEFRDSRYEVTLCGDDGTELCGKLVWLGNGADKGTVTGKKVITGEEMRRILGEKAREGRDRASDAARQGREFINRQRETFSSAVERGREAYNQARGGTTTPPPDAGDTL